MTNELSVEEAIKMLKSKMDGHTDTSYEWAETVRMAIKALEQTVWIPVKWHRRSVDEYEEYEEYPDNPVMIDSPLPEDGQEVLLTIKGKNGKCWVDKDIACCDYDGWYTDGGYDWVDDIIAWMPLPERYKAESEE